MNKNFAILIFAVLLFSACTALQEQAQSISEEALIRTSAGSEVNVDVTFLNPIQKNKDELVFRVALDTHTVDVTGFKIDKLAALKNSERIEVKEGFVWIPDIDSSHHRSGYLRIPAKTKEGAPLISENTEYITLKISGIETDREFKWGKDVLKFM